MLPRLQGCSVLEEDYFCRYGFPERFEASHAQLNVLAAADASARRRRRYRLENAGKWPSRSKA